VNSAGLDTASKTVGLCKGCGSIPPPSAKYFASADWSSARSSKPGYEGSNPSRGAKYVVKIQQKYFIKVVDNGTG
jgi:hypothetical protein